MKDDNEKLKVLFKLLCMWKVEHQNKDFRGTEKLFRQLQQTFEGENVLEFPDPSPKKKVKKVNESVEEKKEAEEIVDDSDNPQPQQFDRKFDTYEELCDSIVNEDEKQLFGYHFCNVPVGKETHHKVSFLFDFIGDMKAPLDEWTDFSEELGKKFYELNVWLKKKMPKSVEVWPSIIKTSIDGDGVRDTKGICRSRNFAQFYADEFIKSPSEDEEEEEDGDEWKKG